MWTKKDDYIFPNNNPGIRIFDSNETKNPGISITQEITPDTDRSAGININIRRKGGLPGNATFLEYHIDALHTDGFDVGDTVLVEADNLNGGNIFGRWTIVASPKNPDAIGITVGHEANILNRSGDKGLKLTRDGNTTVIYQLIPESAINVGDLDTERGYNISFGLLFSPSTRRPIFGSARTYIPLQFEVGTVAHGGIGFLAHGQDPLYPEETTPRSFLELKTTWGMGISFLDTTFSNDNTALEMKPEHKIKFGHSYFSGVPGISNALMMGTDHLFWNGMTRSLYIQGDTIWYRWMDKNYNWHYQRVAGPQ